MTAFAKLGGFKVLKDILWLALIASPGTPSFPSRFCGALAKQRINLPYLTCLDYESRWGVNIALAPEDETKVTGLAAHAFGNVFIRRSRAVILSIFPHKHNPEITGALFETLSREGVEPQALANSPAAVSVVLREENLARASNALFGPFSFSAYRTPEDWKLAQKGRESLYKEVVASYQERRPKVYGLNYRENQELLNVILRGKSIGHFGNTLREFAHLKLHLTFLATSPCEDRVKGCVAFCLPCSAAHSHARIVNRIVPSVTIQDRSPVAIFSMTGPHFGDRYGIAGELLGALEQAGITLLGLTCSIASIKGVVPAEQIHPTIAAIQT
ncbi:MAG: hypothetical protein JW821_00225, partial [Deltaproteobacteria bacterium]|nr:hypothetical protein [Deltaproteobacteria bacterium]